MCFNLWTAPRSSRLNSDIWLRGWFLTASVFLALSYLLCPLDLSTRDVHSTSASLPWQPCLAVMHSVWTELHGSFLSLDAIVGAHVCIRKSHDFSTSPSLQYLHCFSVKYNTESKREDGQGSCSWFICDLFIKMNLFKSFKIYSPNYPRSLLCANCIWENRPSQIKTLSDFSSMFKSICAESVQSVYMG